MRALILCTISASLITGSAVAGPADSRMNLFDSTPRRDPMQITWPSDLANVTPVSPTPELRIPTTLFLQDGAQPARPVAVEYSDAYLMRAKIHKFASFATLPLFAAEVALGQSLDGSNDGKKSAHAVVGAGIVSLFAVNTVTGAWNLFGEGRQDKEGRTLRLVHGLLMMAADVGFLATTASAPSNGRNGAPTFEANRTTHRNLAIASVSVGTAGYLLMLFGNR
jgi:hypothetical protein